MRPYTLSEHQKVIATLAREVDTFHESKIPFRINHGSTNSTRVRDPSMPQLNIAHLNHILSIDIANKTALVEPNVPLDSFLSRTLKDGLMPPVVMEFPGITVGGGFSGASGESSSWKEGLFDCCIDEVEMILGNGQVMRAVKGGENAELFDAARCSLGTLGVVTLLKVRLTEAKDRVLVSYERKGSVVETIDRIVELCEADRADFDFIEAVLYSKEEGIIITGRHIASTSDEARKLSMQRFDRPIDPWFYRHAKGLPDIHSEVVPTESYLFRYDRGAFWGAESFFNYFGIPNTRFTRALFNPFHKTRALYKMMLATGSADSGIIQDLILPRDKTVAFIDYVAEELKIWPLWICPVRKKAADGDVWGWPFWKDATSTEEKRTEENRSHETKDKGTLTLNIGVWGATDGEPANFQRTNRRLEERLRELHGMKVPYAAAFYTEDEFWTLYDRKRYEELRRKWHAEALPTVYDKIRRQEKETVIAEKEPEKDMTLFERMLTIWPFGGLYQVYSLIFR